MSLILDALKKSDQKRQLGQAPTLGSPVIPVRRRRSALPLLLLAITAVAVAGWWFVYRPGAPTAAAPGVASKVAPAVAAPSAVARPAPSAVRNAANTPPLAPGAAVPAVAAVAPPSAAAPGSAPAMVRTPGGLKPAPTAATPTPPSPTATPPPAAVPTAAPPAAASNVTAAATPPPPTPGTARNPVVAPAGASTAAVAAATSAPLPPGTPKSGPPPPAVNPEPRNVPTYYDLAFPVRKDLPALKISMHVYAVEPAQRFIVINGNHEGEGDAIEGGVTVREIRPTDVVLEFQGKTFSVPRGGI